MTEEDLQNRGVNNLKSIRKKKNLSQEKLADKADISRQMMNDIEGKRRWLTKTTLIKLCNALEIDPYELFIPNSFENNSDCAEKEILTNKIITDIENAIFNTLENFKLNS